MKRQRKEASPLRYNRNIKIRLDIVGALLLGGKTTLYTGEFLQCVLKQYPNDTFWLTTRCAGDAEAIVKQIAQYFDRETIILLNMIKPTKWNMAKTDAIDFTLPFLWFDDNLLYREFEQSIGCTRRNGQTKKCLHYLFNVKNTVNIKIWECLRKKQGLNAKLWKEDEE